MYVRARGAEASGRFPNECGSGPGIGLGLNVYGPKYGPIIQKNNGTKCYAIINYYYLHSGIN